MSRRARARELPAAWTRTFLLGPSREVEIVVDLARSMTSHGGGAAQSTVWPANVPCPSGVPANGGGPPAGSTTSVAEGRSVGRLIGLGARGSPRALSDSASRRNCAPPLYGTIVRARSRWAQPLRICTMSAGVSSRVRKLSMAITCSPRSRAVPSIFAKGEFCARRPILKMKGWCVWRRGSPARAPPRNAAHQWVDPVDERSKLRLVRRGTKSETESARRRHHNAVCGAGATGGRHHGLSALRARARGGALSE